jgi:hypothetical protein
LHQNGLCGFPRPIILISWFGYALEAGIMGSLMLVCAVMASLALGVLMAYGICLAMFRIFRVHALAAARDRVTNSPVRVAVEG